MKTKKEDSNRDMVELANNGIEQINKYLEDTK
jgi:hypothetical protein